VVFVVGLPLGAAGLGARADDAALVVPVVLHLPRPLDDAGRERIRVFREAYAPHGICFSISTRELPEAHWHLRTIRERHALRSRLVARRFNVFLVDSADDPSPSESTRRAAERAGFEPSGELAGAHIPAAGAHPATYAFVTSRGSGLSIAHETGHFLGAGHHADPENIMSYAPSRHCFDEAQARVFRARARRLVRTREIERASCDE
jgi:hypothetical protein